MFIGGVGLWVRDRAAPRARQPRSRWATVRDLRQAGCATHGAGVVLGARRHWGRRQVWTFDGPEHVLVLGATRSGKTASVLIPTLLTAETLTHLVFDPKGELYTHTSAWRAPGAGLALLPHR